MRPDDPASLTPDQQLRQPAAALAAGLRRLRRCQAFPETGQKPDPENRPKPVPNGLESSAETRLSVHTG
jgi:hypothetical protein